jgi:hypothetical protein
MYSQWVFNESVRQAEETSRNGYILYGFDLWVGYPCFFQATRP